MIQRSKCYNFVVRVTASAAILTLVSACTTASDSGNLSVPVKEDVRNTGETAPAELQLACASAAPSRLKLASENILPIGSSKVQSNIYRVELKGKGVLAECIIDNNGNIQKMSRL